MGRGLARASSGELEDGITDFSQVIEIDPRYADAYAARGLVYQQINKTEAAIADIERYIELVGEENAADIYLDYIEANR